MKKTALLLIALQALICMGVHAQNQGVSNISQEDTDFQRRATDYMECLKDKDFEKAAKMLMAIDKKVMNENEDNSTTLWLIKTIKNELQEEYAAGIRDYKMVEDKGYKYIHKYDVTVSLNDGTEKVGTLIIQKKLDGKFGSCSLRYGDSIDGIAASRGKVVLAQKAAPTTPDAVATGYMNCVMKKNVDGLANYYPKEKRKDMEYVDLINIIDNVHSMNGGVRSYTLHKKRIQGSEAEYYYKIVFNTGTSEFLYLQVEKYSSGEWGVRNAKFVKP